MSEILTALKENQAFQFFSQQACSFFPSRYHRLM